MIAVSSRTIVFWAAGGRSRVDRDEQHGDRRDQRRHHHLDDPPDQRVGLVQIPVETLQERELVRIDDLVDVVDIPKQLGIPRRPQTESVRPRGSR